MACIQVRGFEEFGGVKKFDSRSVAEFWICAEQMFIEANPQHMKNAEINLGIQSLFISIVCDFYVCRDPYSPIFKELDCTDSGYA